MLLYLYQGGENWKKLEKILFGENLAVGLMFFNPNLGRLLRSSFWGEGEGGRVKLPPV